MATDTKLTLDQQAEQALVQLGEKPRGQAAALVPQLTEPERLAAAICGRDGDKMRLIDLLDHVATRQHLEADFAAHEANGDAGPDDPTDVLKDE